MDRAMNEAILQGVVPTSVLRVTSARHGAVISDVGKGVAAADWIVKQHRIGTKSALTAEGKRAQMRGRDAGKVFVIEGLARTRAVDGLRIAAPGKAVVFDVGG